MHGSAYASTLPQNEAIGTYALVLKDIHMDDARKPEAIFTTIEALQHCLEATVDEGIRYRLYRELAVARAAASLAEEEDRCNEAEVSVGSGGVADDDAGSDPAAADDAGADAAAADHAEAEPAAAEDAEATSEPEDGSGETGDTASAESEDTRPLVKSPPPHSPGTRPARAARPRADPSRP